MIALLLLLSGCAIEATQALPNAFITAYPHRAIDPTFHPSTERKAHIELTAVSKERVHSKSTSTAGITTGVQARGPKSAGWFGAAPDVATSFQVAADGSIFREIDPTVPLRDGWKFISDAASIDHPAEKPSFFHESFSPGPEQAWQTHFPSVKTKGRPPSNSWKRSDSGNWYQDYDISLPAHEGPLDFSAAANKDASWFDTSASQYDAYGRPSAPPSDSTAERSALARLGVDWEERSVNTTLTCADPNCTATTTVALPYDPLTEFGQNCMLSIDFHATDFDDDFSGERVEFIQANGLQINTDCFPRVRGCNESGHVNMFSCVNQFSLDGIINDSSTTVDITAKIPTVVDECPYDGNLLSGVPRITCLVSPRPNTTTPPPAVKPAPRAPPVSFVYVRSPIHCPERNCTAHTSLQLLPPVGATLSECLVNVNVYQTDYDGDLGSTEEISFISVDGVEEATNAKPGKNPCHAKLQGKPLKDSELVFAAVEKYKVANVTSRIAEEGFVLVEVSGGISELVDECAYEGYLFNGYAEMNCTVVASNASAEVEMIVAPEPLPATAPLVPLANATLPAPANASAAAPANAPAPAAPAKAPATAGKET